MRIAINGQKILIDNPAGPERFTINLIRFLAKVDKKNTYTVYLNKFPSESFISELFSGNSNFKYKVVETKFMWTQLGLAKELFREKPEVFFTPIHTLPFLKNRGTKYVSMIHGLEFKTNKEMNEGSIKYKWHKILTKVVINFSDLVVVPSQSTKTNILKEWATLTENKLTIINEGVDDTFRSRATEEISAVLSKYKLEPRKYFLMVSTIQPRKNMANLVKSFSKLIKENPKFADLNLVIAGKLGWNYEEILETPKIFGVLNTVKFLKWVPQSEIPMIFSGALGFVSLSYDEGFGLTVLEAMASKIPVVASKISAHEEVGSDTIKYVLPDDLDQMAKEMAVVANKEYDSELLDKALTRSKNFTWTQTAEKFIAAFSQQLLH